MKQIQDFEEIACFKLKLEGTQQSNLVYNDVCIMSDNYASSDIAKEFNGRDKPLQ